MEYIVNINQRSPRKKISIQDLYLNNLNENNLHLTRLNKKLFKEQIKDTRTIKFLISIILILFVSLLSIGIYHIVLESINNNKNTLEDLQIYNSSVISVSWKYIVEHLEKYVNETNQRSFIRSIINDKNYQLPSYNFVNHFIQNDNTNKAKYFLDKNDCDNFSFIIFGNFLKYQLNYNLTYAFLFGVAYVRQTNDNLHTINIFINDKKDLYCIESQADTIQLCNTTNIDIYRVIF